MQVIYFTEQLGYIKGSLGFQIGFGLTEKYYELLVESNQNKLDVAILIRKILHEMLDYEEWIETLKIKRRPEGILTKRRTINLDKDFFERLVLLAGNFNIARSEIIRRAIEDYFLKRFS